MSSSDPAATIILAGDDGAADALRRAPWTSTTTISSEPAETWIEVRFRTSNADEIRTSAEAVEASILLALKLATLDGEKGEGSRRVTWSVGARRDGSDLAVWEDQPGYRGGRVETLAAAHAAVLEAMAKVRALPLPDREELDALRSRRMAELKAHETRRNHRKHGLRAV